MPKDSRLYMTFPIDFDEHPKVMLLSDAAFRAFVEMNGYSRRHDLDGRISVPVARKRWKVRALSELVASHPERPLVLLEGDSYVIRDYADHQFTTNDLEDLRQKRSAAGRKGRAQQLADKSRASAGQVPGQIRARTETETETTTSNEVVRDRAKRGSRLSPDWQPSPESRAKVAAEAPHVNPIAETETFRDYWIAQPGQKGVKADWDATWRNWMRRKESDWESRRTGKPTRTEENLSVVARYAAMEHEQKAIG